MIKADIPQDVTEYREQLALGMNLRQIICVVSMLALAVPSFLFLNDVIRTDVLMYIILLEVAPLAAIGFFRYNGLPFEKVVVKVFDFYVGNQRRRMKYQPEEAEVHDILRKIVLAELEEDRKLEKKGKKRKIAETDISCTDMGGETEE